MLNRDSLSHALTQLNFLPEIDLFASRLNSQFTHYVAYRPDPGAVAIDAFSPWLVHSKILCLSSFQCDSSCFKKNKGQQSDGGMCIAQLAHASMAPPGDENGHLREHQHSGQQTSPAPSKPTQCEPSTTQATLPSGLSLIRQTLIGHRLSTKAKDIIMASWHTGTTIQYDVYFKRWEQFCQSKGINHLDASVENGIDFLATLFTSGLDYSAINTARSALSSVLILPRT